MRRPPYRARRGRGSTRFGCRGDACVAPNAPGDAATPRHARPGDICRSFVGATHASPKGCPNAGASTESQAMTYDPAIHRRRSIRLRDYDYSSGGAYFVTICAAGRRCIFGAVWNGEMSLNRNGRSVVESWEAIADHFPQVDLDAFVVMPNHVHGILFLHTDSGVTRAGATHASPLRGGALGPARGSVGAVVGSFKSGAARRINQLRNSLGAAVWQRNYYERVIRDDGELADVRQYIMDNPARWADDSENPANAPPPRRPS
ncbi:MAG: transposase [Deferrisomatales bacterium]|nr:transposase [Deferrisomatales bacterium]